MGATISTHNGSAVARDHNIRNRKVTDKESHIDPNGRFEIWHDERLVDAYHRLFDEAVENYNAKQKRADRRIQNYLTEVTKDRKKHPVYEMIIGVYGKDIPEETKEEILREFVGGWTVRNPNLEMIGAYFHADEQGKDPHVHIDYIPVARGYKRGMETQNGLVKALEQQGLWGGKDGLTGQIRWEQRENAVLELLCNERGIEVDHPGTGRKHLDTPEYKALMAELDVARAELKDSREQIKMLEQRHKAERQALNNTIDRKAAERQSYMKISSDVYKQKQVLKDVSERVQTAREEAEYLDAFIAGSRDEVDTYQEAAEEAAQKAQEAQEAEEAAKSRVEALEAKETALTAKVDELIEEAAIWDAALKEKKATGRVQLGDALDRRISDAREIAELKKRVSVLEAAVKLRDQFIQSIPGLWQQLHEWLARIQQSREKKRAQPDIGDK